MEGNAAIYENEPALYPDGKIPEWKPETPWEHFLGWYEERLEKPDESGRIEKHEETVEGRRLVRLDIYRADALGKEILVRQIWADPSTRLPVRSRSRLQLGLREREKREWETSTYDFPDKGPESIYELGVPRGLPVVKTERKYLPEDVQALLEKAKAARDRFPTNYRAVIWNNDSEAEAIDVIYRNGLKFRWDRYRNHDSKYPAYHLPLPASVDEVLHWCPKQTSMQAIVFDGERQFLRHNPYPEDVPAVRYEATVSVIRHRPQEYFRMQSHTPDAFQWPFLDRGGPAEIIVHPEEDPTGCIALRFGGAGDYRQDCYVDPQRDYLCVKWVYWRKQDGAWRKDWEDWLLDLRRLPDGRWYATRRMRIQYGDPEKGFGLQTNYSHIDVKVLKDDEFPPGTFDGEKLLEGAKVETY
jgi:hypothetical protein